MSSHPTSISPELHEYVLETSIREPDEIRRIRERTETREDSRMQTSPEQGQFLALLLQTLGGGNVIEVGTFTGYGAAWMATALRAGARVTTCEIDPDNAAAAREGWAAAGLAERIDVRVGPALETLNSLIEAGGSRTFDLAYIDADKVSYDAYYEACLRLVRYGGIVAIDNVLWGGAVADDNVRDESTTAIRALNAKLLGDDRVDVSLLTVGDGLYLARRR